MGRVKKVKKASPNRAELTLFDSERVKKKLTVMCQLEAMFDDADNYKGKNKKGQDDYYDLVSNIQLGDSIRVIVERIERQS
jgi:hypothetical protein